MLHIPSATEYIAESGLRIGLKPVRPILVQRGLMVLEDEWRKRGEAVDVPTYTVKQEDLDDQTFPLDETSLDDPNSAEQTRINHSKWNHYQECLARLSAAKGERETVLMLALGTEFTMPEDESWREEQAWMGLTIPTDPLDLKVHYLTTVVLSQIDLSLLLPQINMLSMKGLVKPEQVAQFQSDLRRAVERRAGDTISKALQEIGKLVDGEPLPGDDSGVVLGQPGDSA
jgi:hypothetical protein